ncbi:Transposon Ty3-G Gag-Pol polyprotein [Araneus ventricosus]|uniref:Transposon Ty3-G Gag-Pol polyprotein n=1 Tax=Araneus ventricosus TaxID=182803 RepID=A0A4Y2KE44_ARAVE|nr:Transposon Ty3-G Gag-Pol polyprotein [Araneus ventricosus]
MCTTPLLSMYLRSYYDSGGLSLMTFNDTNRLVCTGPKTDPSQSREKEVEAVLPEETAAIVGEDLTPLNLPPADKEAGKLVEACFLQAEKENSEYQIRGEENQERETEELAIPYPVSDPNIYDFERIKADSALEGRLSLTEIESLKQLLGRHQKIFSNDPGKTHLVEHDFELISNKPIRSKPYRTSQRQNEILKSEIKRMLDLNIIEIGQSDYASPMIFVESPGKDPRPCIDYRLLNANVRTQFSPLPNIEERVERVATAKYITVIDLAKGYWQIPLSERARRYSAFFTSFGTYIPLRMPFGLVNASYFFSKLITQVLENCDTFAVPYLDDTAIFSYSWEDHLKHVDEVLKRIGNAQLTIKPSKCKFAQNHTKYLGHIVGGGARSPAEAKLKAVMDFPTPTTKSQIRAFLGLSGYYAHYVKIFSLIAAPLTKVLKSKVKKKSKLDQRMYAGVHRIEKPFNRNASSVRSRLQQGIYHSNGRLGFRDRDRIVSMR